MEELDEDFIGDGQGDKRQKVSNSQREQLFRIAFRNYINLVALADKKAGLLIQVSSILPPVVYGFVIKRIEQNYFYALPTASILIGSIITIFYGVLASKPLRKEAAGRTIASKEQFFFGSYDRLDSEFKHVSYEKYSQDINQFFKGDKKYVFEELIKESFEVRKVLSRKFVYLSHAYKVFFAGLLLGISGFIIIIIYELKFTST